MPLRQLVSQGEGRERIGRGVILERAHPHPPLSASLLLSFTMKSTSCRLAGTVAVGNVSIFFGFRWIFAILELSGNG